MDEVSVLAEVQDAGVSLITSALKGYILPERHGNITSITELRGCKPAIKDFATATLKPLRFVFTLVIVFQVISNTYLHDKFSNLFLLNIFH